MLATLLSVSTLFFFVTIAMAACALVGSLLFDLMPVLDNGDERTRQPLVFPAVAERAEAPSRVVRFTPARAARPAATLRAAA